MASNKSDFLDPAATVGRLTKFASQRVLNRRHFIGGLGIAGAAAGSGLLSAHRAIAQEPVHTAGYAQVDVLNFLLNVKYLKGTFYSFITQGADLPASSGVTIGTGQIYNQPAKIAFATQQITDMLNEIYYDELNQLIDLRSLIESLSPSGGVVGYTPVAARQTINMLGTGTATVVTTTMTAVKALAVARVFEDLSVTAFAGAAQYLSGTNLSYVAQTLGVDGLHGGALRLAIIQQNAASAGIADLLADSNVVPPTATITTVAAPGTDITGQMVADDVAPFDQGSAASASAGPVALTAAQSVLASGVTITNPCYDPQSASTAPAQTCTPTQYGGFFDTVGSATSTGSSPGGFIFARTFSQVLSILYAPLGPGTYPAQINANTGGYFPVGVSGSINTV